MHMTIFTRVHLPPGTIIILFQYSASLPPHYIYIYMEREREREVRTYIFVGIWPGLKYKLMNDIDIIFISSQGVYIFT